MNRKISSAISPYLSFDKKSVTPFYKQIYDGYRSAILSGQLGPGQLLPSTRALATELNISRLPVVNAYEQLLHEGYIEGKIGAGTYVKDTIPDELSKPDIPFDSIKFDPKDSPCPENLLGPFRISLPALDFFPTKIWSRLVFRHAKNASIEEMAYGDPAGLMILREAIAQYLRTARAVRCEAQQIIIVSGSQLALQICARGLIESKDGICVEEPGYPGARDAFRSAGMKLYPVQMDDEGIRISEVMRLGKKIRAIYVTPSHQYPLGLCMSASRRLELLDWAEETKSWIIEDDYDSEYRYASRPIGALQGMDHSSRVIYIGTFSKVLFPSLRLGYIVVPFALYNKFVQARETLDIFSPILSQLVLADFLREGYFARHIRRMRAIYLLRRNALLQSIDLYMADVLKPFNTDAGLHLSAFLPQRINDREIVRKAAKAGISVTALSTCYAASRSRNGLILGFGGAAENKIKEASKTLSKLI
jgi:GntR family transcriptional regulator/MocR family aminotransferase